MKVTEKTMIPLRWVFILLSMSGSGLIGAMGVGIWVSRVDTAANAQEERVKKLESANTSQSSTLSSIDRRLSRIEGKLGIEGRED